MGWMDVSGKIESILVTDDEVKITTDQGTYDFEAEGDCCASAYIHEPNSLETEYFIGALIHEAKVSDAPRQVMSDEEEDSDDDEGYARDIHFYELYTNKGILTITLYVDHKGYYSGRLVPRESPR